MSGSRRAVLLALLALSIRPAAVLAGLHEPSDVAAELEAFDAPQVREGQGRGERLIFRDRIEPHWFDGGTRFWYRNDLAGGAREFVLVDAAKGVRAPAFDHERLAAALAKAAGREVRADRLPFDRLAFDPEAKAVRVMVGDKAWRIALDTYECTEANDATFPEDEPAAEGDRPRGRPRDRRPDGDEGSGQELRSPDGKRTAFVNDHNVYVRTEGEAEEARLSEDGKEGLAYGRLAWAPDSETLVAFRIEPGDRHEVHLIQSSPPGGGRAKLQSRPYPLPGDKFPTFELNLFRVAERKPIKPEVDTVDFGVPRLRWHKDGRRFTYTQVDRGHQRFRVIEVDSHDGKARALIDERSETFIWTAHAENVEVRPVTWLESTGDFIYASERDGWRHLYLVDAEAGVIKNQITKGEFVVRGVDHVDEDAKQVWFRASGKAEGQDPYFLHAYRVNFDGSGLVALTEGDGHHTVQYSPDRSYLIDTYSRVDLPPVHELRRTSDGSLVCALEAADASALKASGWEAPEVFAAKGRDGTTDIWGIICRPKGFDPTKRYPVIEQIYAGPQGSFVPKTFSPRRRFGELTDLGFVVVQVDGMGTANRSKAFHDVCWRNLKDAGFPDRILWHKAVAAKYPWYDLARVGIYGGSAGGQNAAAGVLFHPEFYTAAVAGCGCHDNRMDKASWNEQWMGYPVGPWYSESSNIDNAQRLRGKLMLIVGEMDTNVPPESTYRLADALIRAGKDFDLVVVPNAGHGMGGPYGQRRLQDFFVRHLRGAEPPDRNAAAPLDAAVARASAPAGEAPRAGEPELEGLDLGPEPSELRGAIERFATDRGSLLRSAPPAASPGRDERMRSFLRDWLGRLSAVDFDRLGRDGQIDYLLFKNHLDHEVAVLDRRSRERSEAEPYAPFAAPILELDRARRAVEPQDWAEVAGTLTRLARDIKEAQKALADGDRKEQGGVKRATANRANALVEDLRRTLQGWFRFYDGYDPLFTWWNQEPYKAADAALQEYARVLRDRLGLKAPRDEDEREDEDGGPPRRRSTASREAKEDGSDVVGNPIGREALMEELAFERVADTPEELVRRAEAELAWCESEMRKAAREMGCGDDWRAALERVKDRHVEPGQQPKLIRDLAIEAIEYLDANDLVTVPPLCRESWRIAMMSPERQLVNPFFTGGETISVSFPTSTMSHEAKRMSLRGNNRHFARATVHHEVIPGHHLQGFMTSRHRTYRQLFGTPFWVEGWALYWELLLWDRGFAKSPEDRVGMLFWRMHRCARIIFSLKFHLGEMTAKECIELLVERVGHERDNATAEVRRSFETNYGPLYQAAYLLGGLQLRALHRELVESGKMTDRAFHDAILKENAIPIAMVRAILTGEPLARDQPPIWRFGDPAPKE